MTDLLAAIVNGTHAIRLGLAGKPAPVMLAEAAQRLGVPPERAAVIEDADVRAGVAGGFDRVIGIDRGDNRARLGLPAPT